MIKIHKAKNRQFYFTVQARNGQVIVTSEMYKSHRGCMKGVYAVLKVCKGAVTIIKDLTAKPAKKKK